MKRHHDDLQIMNCNFYREEWIRYEQHKKDFRQMMVEIGVPRESGIYLVTLNNSVYVGKSTDLLRRICQHFAPKDKVLPIDALVRQWYSIEKDPTSFGMLWTPCEGTAEMSKMEVTFLAYAHRLAVRRLLIDVLNTNEYWLKPYLDWVYGRGAFDKPHTYDCFARRALTDHWLTNKPDDIRLVGESLLAKRIFEERDKFKHGSCHNPCECCWCEDCRAKNTEKWDRFKRLGEFHRNRAEGFTHFKHPAHIEAVSQWLSQR